MSISMKEVSKNIFIPMPMTVIGTAINGKNNFMAAGWVTRVNANPPMIAIGIGSHHYTAELIQKNKTFSVNICGKDMLVKTDYCGIYSGGKTDKSDIFSTFNGKLPGAPLIEGAIVALECTLVEAVKLQTNTLFIGEITGAWSDDRFITNKFPDYKKGDAYFLTMPDNSYWAMGEQIGKAWSDGKDYK
jgi:flavin reductase (DIM6/NTAB) family NADH-FMN oxidoreductase RutF